MPTIINSDAMLMSNYVKPESVGLIVTSPPYWSIVDYGIDGQIGYGQNYDEYLDSMVSVFSECAKTLLPGGRMCINIGEQYLSTKEHGRYRVIPIPQDLTSVLHSLECLDYMGAIIWNKIPTQNASGGGKWMGSTYWPTEIILAFEHEYILVFRKHGKRNKPSKEILEASKLTKKERGEWSRAMWKIAPERGSDHPAPFPVQLPYRLIRMFSFYGDVVLDPFLGSGTTMVAAMELGRDCIGFELSPEWAKSAYERCSSMLIGGDVKIRNASA